MSTTKKTTTSKADDLNDEPTEATGKRLVVRFKDEDFEMADVAHDRPWREVAGLLAAASGEQGISQIEPALAEILGADQLAKTDAWTFADFAHFSAAVGERIGASVGSPGESHGSRR